MRIEGHRLRLETILMCQVEREGDQSLMAAVNPIEVANHERRSRAIRLSGQGTIEGHERRPSTILRERKPLRAAAGKNQRRNALALSTDNGCIVLPPAHGSATVLHTPPGSGSREMLARSSPTKSNVASPSSLRRAPVPECDSPVANEP